MDTKPDPQQRKALDLWKTIEVQAELRFHSCRK